MKRIPRIAGFPGADSSGLLPRNGAALATRNPQLATALLNSNRQPPAGREVAHV